MTGHRKYKLTLAERSRRISKGLKRHWRNKKGQTMEGKDFSTKYTAASDAPKQNPTGFEVVFDCQGCGKDTRIAFKPGQFTRDYVEGFAGLMDGTSKLFVIPVANDDPGPIGRCSYCGKRNLKTTIVEFFDLVDIEAGRLNFEAYTRTVGGKTHDNRPIPTWDALTPNVRKGWIVGAFVVKLQASAFADYPMNPIPFPIKEGTE